MTARELRKGSPRWRGLRQGKPVIIHCHDHTEFGLCPDCLADFDNVLVDAPHLLDDLDIAIAGETRFVEHGFLFDSGTDHMGVTPLVTAYHRLAQALALAGEWFNWRHPEQLARLLHANLNHLANDPHLPNIAHTISTAAARAHRVIERPDDWAYFGPCPDCNTDIYGLRETIDTPDARVKCRACDYSELMIDHQRAQLDAGDDRMLTIDELVGAITRVGEVVTRKQILKFVAHEGVTREWRQVPTLIDTELHVDQVEVYRLGDIRVLADGENPANIGTITCREVARQFGVTEAAVWKLVERNQLEPVRRASKPLRFKLAEVERYRLTKQHAGPVAVSA